VPFAQIDISAQDAAGENKRAENPDDQSARVTPLFFFDGDWFSFELI